MSDIPPASDTPRSRSPDSHYGDIIKQVSATNTGDVGAKFDGFAMRTQIAF